MPLNYEYECGTCGKEFPAGWRARDMHCNATGHRRPAFECDTCYRFFNSESARCQHMNATNHFFYECDFCDETYPDEKGRKEHEIETHHYCADCDRHFQSYNNIQMHLRSRIHLGSGITCPFCKTQYSTAAGMTHHVERGACPQAPRLDRDSIYKIIRSQDPKGLISKKLIGWHSSDHYEATGLAWNGRGYQCYLCSRVFNRLQDLNQHLASPAHQQALYHCPNRSCGKEFTTLGALVNHLESESCSYMRFQAVQKSFSGLVSGNRLLC